MTGLNPEVQQSESHSWAVDSVDGITAAVTGLPPKEHDFDFRRPFQRRRHVRGQYIKESRLDPIPKSNSVRQHCTGNNGFAAGILITSHVSTSPGASHVRRSTRFRQGASRKETQKEIPLSSILRRKRPEVSRLSASPNARSQSAGPGDPDSAVPMP